MNFQPSSRIDRLQAGGKFAILLVELHYSILCFTDITSQDMKREFSFSVPLEIEVPLTRDRVERPHDQSSG